LFFAFVLWYLDLNSRSTLSTTPPALFSDGLFWNRVSQTIYPGWLWTVNTSDLFLPSS
jgi:hypothetical protein